MNWMTIALTGINVMGRLFVPIFLDFQRLFCSEMIIPLVRRDIYNTVATLIESRDWTALQK